MLGRADPRQHQRNVAGDAKSPQARLRLPVPSEYLLSRPDIRVEIEETGRESLAEAGLLHREIELSELDLAVHPGQHERPASHSKIPIPPGEDDRLFPRGRRSRRKSNLDRLPG